jgi:hypothetical protein
MVMDEIERRAQIKALKAVFRRVKYRVYTVCHTVARSGMSRTLSVYVVGGNDGSIRCLNWDIEQLGIAKRNKDGELTVHGCGL